MSADLRHRGHVKITHQPQESRIPATCQSNDEKWNSSPGIDLFYWNLLEEKETFHPCKESTQRDHPEPNCRLGDSDQSRLNAPISPTSK